jgi:hypothetical protein
MKLGLICLALALASMPTLALATCYDTDFSTYGGRLDEGMTESQVAQAMGFQPNMVTLETCGYDSKNGAWQCKIETWGSPCKGDLRVYFVKAGGVWVVNNWDADAALGF